MLLCLKVPRKLIIFYEESKDFHCLLGIRFVYSFSFNIHSSTLRKNELKSFFACIVLCFFNQFSFNFKILFDTSLFNDAS